MSTIKPVKVTKTDALAQALDEAQKRCSARTFDADDIARIVKDAERRLAIVPKKLWQGAVVGVTHSGPWANSYGYHAEGTRVTLRRRSADWVLEGVERVAVYPKQGERVSLTLAGDVPVGEVLTALVTSSGLNVPGINPDFLQTSGSIADARNVFPRLGRGEEHDLVTSNPRAFRSLLPQMRAWAKALPEMRPDEIVAITEHFGDRVNPSKVDADTLDALMHLRGDGEVATPDLWEALIVGKREAKYAA